MTEYMYPWDAPVSFGAVPWGVDHTGKSVTLPLAESSVLLGGPSAPSARVILAGAARMPHAAQPPSVALVGFDLRGDVLGAWAPRFSRVATTADDATVVLEALVDELERRYTWLATERRPKVTPDDLSADLPLVLVYTTELGDLVATGETPDATAADRHRATLVRRLLSAHRAVGVSLVLATASPVSAVIPSQLRDLTRVRIIHTPAPLSAAHTVLGHHDCDRLDAAGHAYLRQDGDRDPLLARPYTVSDAEVAALVERTAPLRVALPWMPDA